MVYRRWFKGLFLDRLLGLYDDFCFFVDDNNL